MHCCVCQTTLSVAVVHLLSEESSTILMALWYQRKVLRKVSIEIEGLVLFVSISKPVPLTHHWEGTVVRYVIMQEQGRTFTLTLVSALQTYVKY